MIQLKHKENNAVDVQNIIKCQNALKFMYIEQIHKNLQEEKRKLKLTLFVKIKKIKGTILNSMNKQKQSQRLKLSQQNFTKIKTIQEIKLAQALHSSLKNSHKNKIKVDVLLLLIQQITNNIYCSSGKFCKIIQSMMSDCMSEYRKNQQIIKDIMQMKNKAECLEEENKKLKKQLDETRRQLKQTKQQFQKYKIQSQQRFTNIQSRLNSLIQPTKTQSTKQISIVEPIISELSIYAHPLNPNKQSFKFNANKLQYIGQNNIWTMYILNRLEPIQSMEQEYSFKMKILKYGQRNYYIMIGMVDCLELQKQLKINKQNRSMFASGNAYTYYREYHGRGCKFPGGKQQGRGFGQGDIVQVTYKKNKGTIQWIVNGKQEADDIIHNHEAEYAPYIEVFHTGSIIEILKL